MHLKQAELWQKDWSLSPQAIGCLSGRRYHGLVSGAGGLLLLWGGWQVYQSEHNFDFLLLFSLAVLATLATSTVQIGNSRITYSIDPIVSFAVLPLLGIGAAIVIKAGATLSLWLVKEKGAVTWQKSWSQVLFNSGVHSLSLWAAGALWLTAHQLLADFGVIAKFVPWLLAAIVYDQVNLWLVIGSLSCQTPTSTPPLARWRAEWWATQLFVLSYAIGGALLAFAIAQYDRWGIVIFFLPVLLSAYAFWLYSQQLQRYTDNVEALVTVRTQELTELQQRKEHFLTLLSHDMMTPLTNIRYGASLIHHNPSNAADNSQIAKLILNSQESLLQMMRNLLDREKVLAGRAFIAHKQPCDLVHLLTTLTATMQLPATERGIGLHMEVAADLPVACVDAQQIERIVTNLLANALKYTAVGGWVCLHAYHAHQQIVLTVEDSGFGIAAEVLPTIFERFKYTPQHHTQASSRGLGLAIVKALVTAHDGTIFVESAVGQGSKFTVTLPINTTQ